MTRLQGAHQTGRPSLELIRLRRYGLIIVDEVGYFPFEQDAANLFFQLPGRRLRDDRPHRPPRGSPHPQRLQVPAQEPPDRIAALDKTRKYGRIIPSTWLSFHPTKRLNFRPALTR